MRARLSDIHQSDLRHWVRPNNQLKGSYTRTKNELIVCNIGTATIDVLSFVGLKSLDHQWDSSFGHPFATYKWTSGRQKSFHRPITDYYSGFRGCSLVIHAETKGQTFNCPLAQRESNCTIVHRESLETT